MRAGETEDLPAAWFTPSTDVYPWCEGSTYQSIPYSALPPLPERSAQGLSWLRDAPRVEDALGPECAVEQNRGAILDRLGQRVDRLAKEAGALDLTLPPTLRPFMTDTQLHGRVPTCTACYLDLPDRLIEAPNGISGWLLRFMNDQQCCLLWFLRLQPGGGHDVVCAQPEFTTERGDSLEDIVTLHHLCTCAPSFDDFVHRFWLENTLWYAMRGDRPLTAEERAYVEYARTPRES